MLFGDLDYRFVLGLVRIGGSRRQGPGIFPPLGHVEPREIVIIIETILSLGDRGLAVAVRNNHVYDDVPLALAVVH